MRPRVLRASVPAVLVVLMCALAGCVDAPVTAGAPAGTAAPASSAPATSPATSPAPDVDFASAMVPHHQQALELSALVEGRSSSPAVADLAFRIDREQVEEVGQLQGFLRLRDAAPSTMHDMAGMADTATLARLRASSGPAFDRLWLTTMTAHHEGALTMARDYLAGPPGALADFARSVLVTQQAEIDRMRGVGAQMAR